MGEARLRFEPLGTQHLLLRRDFDCGVEALNRYLAERARKENDVGLARVRILFDPGANRIAGFYTLSSVSVRFTEVPACLTKRLTPYSDLPAMLIGRLAADSRYQGQGLGRTLVLDALARIRAHVQEIGAFLAVVDAKDESVVAFYEKYGFEPLVDHPRRLFLPTATIPEL